MQDDSKRENKERKATDNTFFSKTLRRFRRNKFAQLGLFVILVLYLLALFAPFVAPYRHTERHGFPDAPPQFPRFIDEEGQFHLRPFVYGLETGRDPETFERITSYNTDEKYKMELFVRGDSYNFFGLIETDLRLFGAGEGKVFLFGTDEYGRDLFSRVLIGSRVSLTIGLVGVFVSAALGTVLGIVSGYLGGWTDELIQRVVEILRSFPALPLWMMLAAIIPPQWSSYQIFLAIAAIMGLLRWTAIARQVRGKALSFREEEFILAAKAIGASDLRVIFHHLWPNLLSLILVLATIEVPKMILAESSLSFLGLGIQPPMVSWGTLLSSAQQVRKVLGTPWVFIPGAFIVVAVLAFNFVGDGLRDATDPYFT